jgi:antitoxin (DNA-binding transcriptional repressor) of toxin-antitoxin stability system
MDQVRDSGAEIIITKRGQPVAKLTGVRKTKRRSVFGCMKGTAETLGDIAGPIGEVWNAER